MKKQLLILTFLSFMSNSIFAYQRNSLIDAVQSGRLNSLNAILNNIDQEILDFQDDNGNTAAHHAVTLYVNNINGENREMANIYKQMIEKIVTAAAAAKLNNAGKFPFDIASDSLGGDNPDFHAIRDIYF